MSQTRSRAASGQAVESYEIRVWGHLGPLWATRLEVSNLCREADGTTVLRIEQLDQAALHGLLHKIRDLGLPLISVLPVDRVETTCTDRSLPTTDD